MLNENNMAEEKSYSKALEEINEIVESLRSGKADVDTLSEKVKRATELIKFCKERLSKTEESVNKILQEE